MPPPSRHHNGNLRNFRLQNNGLGANHPADGRRPPGSPLSRSSATAGGPSFTLTINGSNFASGANLGWNLLIGSVAFPSTSTVASCTPSTILISIDSKGAPTGGSAASVSGDGPVAAFQSIVATIQQIVVAATGF